MDQFRIRPITEADVASIIRAAGGERAHPDQGQRTAKGADFACAGAAIELKLLDEDGLEKTQRQEKLACLFRGEGFDAPVVVLDRGNLSDVGKRGYDHAVEGPIKTEVSSARKQLKQTRTERPDANLSILWVINNGYTALNHEQLERLVAHRARNDTSNIDGVIVGGCYFHSDGFDSYFLWPLSYVPIGLGHFAGFDALHDAWREFANGFMTATVAGDHLGDDLIKGPVVDTQFEVDGVTFVKPAPPIGGRSDFYIHGRPRKDSTGLASCPPVALTFPGLTRAEWAKIRRALPHEPDLLGSYEDWLREHDEARGHCTSLQPLVTIPIGFVGWQSWCAVRDRKETMASVRDYANAVFQDRVQAKIAFARELKPGGLAPARCILAVTDEIGQDKANDLSHIAKVRQRANGAQDIPPIVQDIRIFHEHAVALASAYAVSEGLESVMWIRRRRYAWA